MKKYLLILVFLVLLLGLLAARLPPSSYRSAWQTVPPGQVALFPHPLNKEPDLLFVWLKLNPGDKTVRPWTEFYGIILVNSVDTQYVTIQNADSTQWEISIFVR